MSVDTTKTGQNPDIPVSNTGDYVKTGTTTMCRFTGDNAAEVRRFCVESAAGVRGTPWGFATAGEFGSPHYSYRSFGTPPCPENGGYDDTTGSYRGDTPDGAVYDRVHSNWVGVWAGDFVARGPEGENYPVLQDPRRKGEPLKYAPSRAVDDVRPAVTLVLDAMTDELHESLCHCVDYPEGCKSRSDYRRDNLVHNLTYAEAALEMALKMGWAPPAV